MAIGDMKIKSWRDKPPELTGYGIFTPKINRMRDTQTLPPPLPPKRLASLPPTSVPSTFVWRSKPFNTLKKG